MLKNSQKLLFLMVNRDFPNRTFIIQVKFNQFSWKINDFFDLQTQINQRSEAYLIFD